MTTLTVSDRFLLLGRRSGALNRFTLPHLTAENSYFLNGPRASAPAASSKTKPRQQEPARLEFNASSTRVAVVDTAGVLTVLDLEGRADGSDQGSGNVFCSPPVICLLVMPILTLTSSSPPPIPPLFSFFDPHHPP